MCDARTSARVYGVVACWSPPGRWVWRGTAGPPSPPTRRWIGCREITERGIVTSRNAIELLKYSRHRRPTSFDVVPTSFLMVEKQGSMRRCSKDLTSQRAEFGTSQTAADSFTEEGHDHGVHTDGSRDPSHHRAKHAHVRARRSGNDLPAVHLESDLLGT